MIKEVENNYKYSLKDTRYVKKTYSGNKKMHPLSFCVIRFRYLIKKNYILLMKREDLLKRIIMVSKEFKKLINFANL